MINLGIPTNSELKNRDDIVFVHEYLREDGTVVRAHNRSKPENGISIMNSTNKVVTDNITFGESIINDLAKDAGIIFPLANANLQNATNNFIAAKNYDHAHIIRSVSEIKDKNLLDLMKRVNIPENSKGVYYDINSQYSKNLFHSNEIQSYLKNNIGTLFNTDKTIVADIEFLSKNDYDNYLGVQNCKLFNPKIGKDGYFDAKIIDYYDFEYRMPNNIFDFKKHINNWGYSMQEKNQLWNYFNISYPWKNMVINGNN